MLGPSSDRYAVHHDTTLLASPSGGHPTQRSSPDSPSPTLKLYMYHTRSASPRVHEPACSPTPTQFTCSRGTTHRFSKARVRGESYGICAIDANYPVDPASTNQPRRASGTRSIPSGPNVARSIPSGPNVAYAVDTKHMLRRRSWLS